jgi:hypothetical protein
VAFCSQFPISLNGNTDRIHVSPNYFTTIQARLLPGRDFTEEDGPPKPRVIMIDNALARIYFPSEDPVGKMVGNLDRAPKSLRRLVGVVDHIRERHLDEPMVPTEYFPFRQDQGTDYSAVVSSKRDESSVLPSIASAIRDIDPAIVTTNAAGLSRRHPRCAGHLAAPLLHLAAPLLHLAAPLLHLAAPLLHLAAPLLHLAARGFCVRRAVAGSGRALRGDGVFRQSAHPCRKRPAYSPPSGSLPASYAPSEPPHWRASCSSESRHGTPQPPPQWPP